MLLELAESMPKTVTTSIRIPVELRHLLEQTARRLNRGKNWIIVQALREYLAKVGHENLREEARRQSLLASQQQTEEEEAWERAGDHSGWRTQ